MNKTTFIEKQLYDDPVGNWYLCTNCNKEVFLPMGLENKVYIKFCPHCGYKIIPIQEENEIEDLLNKLGLYQTPWVTFESVIKAKSNEYTIFIKYQNQDWEWYNQKFFMDIQADPNDKKQLLDLLKPVDGPEDEISEG